MGCVRPRGTARSSQVPPRAAEGWEQLEYDEFLERRQKHIALVIRTAFDKLRTGTAAVPGVSGRAIWAGPSVRDLVAGEESTEVEFKQTGVGKHAQTGKPQFPSYAVITIVAAFLNSSSGGTLGTGYPTTKRSWESMQTSRSAAWTSTSTSMQSPQA